MKSNSHLVRALVLALLIPAVWVALDAMGSLTQLRNFGMDLRYVLRGEKPSPADVFYVDLDADSVALFGERPWPRGHFADVASFLFRLGGARVVGFDFIFSPVATSAMVPPEKSRESDQSLAVAIQLFPGIVLAADYDSQLQLPYMEVPATRPDFARLRELDPAGVAAALRAYPETPTFPIIGTDWGTVGLISYDPGRSGDAVPRWVPAYAPYKGEARSRGLMEGMRRFHGLPPEAVQVDGPDLVLIHPEWGEVERLPLLSEGNLYHFSIEMVRLFHQLPPEAIQVEEGAVVIRDGDRLLHRIPLDQDGMLEINWYSRWRSPYNPRCSIVDLYYYVQQWESGDPTAVAEAEEWFSQFKDAIILIGPVDPKLQDLAPTPFDGAPVPKVGVHGNLIKMIMGDGYIQRLPYAVNTLIIWLLALIVTVLVLSGGRHSVLCRFVAVAVFIGYAALAIYLFDRHNLVLPLVLPLAATLSTVLCALAWQLIAEERQKGRIKGMFGTYVAPALVDRMIESGEEPQLGGMEQELTCFFSDVESFSAFSEQLTPTRLVELMNEYLTAMTDILQEEGAALDKYIGDAIVAMFGAPLRLDDHALRACRAAVRMQNEQQRLVEKWRAEGDRWPSLIGSMRTRIGINTGAATVGNMGSRNRFNYTMMGDTVNLAARCESAAKLYGVYTLISADVWQAAGGLESGLFARRIDRVAVKGRKSSVDLYELCGERNQVSAECIRCAELYQQAFDAYLARDFSSALHLFEEARELEPQPARSPSNLLANRCRTFLATPPADDWNGVFSLSEK